MLGTTVLAGSANAESLSELQQRLAELKQKVALLEARLTPDQMVQPMIAPAQSVMAGSYRRSIKLPGTNTSMRIFTFAKLDVHYTTVQGVGDSFFAFSIPATGTAQDLSGGTIRMHARQSQISLETRTPTDYGQVETFIATDFYGVGGTETVSNGSGLRIRHAYGTIGKFLIGHTWSNFMIVGALADTIDFGGPVGIWFGRQGQVRYTVPFADDWKLEVSVENPQSVFVASATSRFHPGLPPASFSGVGSNEDRIPDFTAKVTFGGSWGFLSLAGLLGVYDINTLTTIPVGAVTPLDEREVFFAIHGGGRINTFGRDSIGFTASYNDGGGRIFYPFFTPSAYVNVNAAGTPSIETIESVGFNAHYEHWWTDNLYSVAAYGISYIFYPSQTVPAGTTRPTFIGLTETLQTVHVNLQWVPVPRVSLGIEWIFGINDFNIANAALAAGADDDNTVHRIQFSIGFAL